MLSRQKRKANHLRHRRAVPLSERPSCASWPVGLSERPWRISSVNTDITYKHYTSFEM